MKVHSEQSPPELSDKFHGVQPSDQGVPDIQAHSHASRLDDQGEQVARNSIKPEFDTLPRRNPCESRVARDARVTYHYIPGPGRRERMASR